MRWTVIFGTATEITAVKLLNNLLRRLDRSVTDVWLRPWGEELDRYAAQFRTTVSLPPNDSRFLGEIFRLAGAISATWTVDLSRDGHAGPGVQAWTPREYRKPTMEGIADAWFAIEGKPDPAGAVPIEGAGVYLRTLRDGTIAHIVRRP